jgi:hypothetical protein
MWACFIRGHSFAHLVGCTNAEYVHTYRHVFAQAKVRLWPPGCRGFPRPEQNDVVLAAVLQHFARRAAWDAAADFFAEVAHEHAPAVVHLCAALWRLGRGDDAVQARSPLCHSLRS